MNIENEWSICYGSEDENMPHEPNPCKILKGGAECVECGGFIPNEKGV